MNRKWLPKTKPIQKKNPKRPIGGNVPVPAKLKTILPIQDEYDFHVKILPMHARQQ